MKTVIQVWTHHCYNMPQTETDNYWGLGDILRGTIQLYMLSKKLGFQYYVDTQLHPISKFLVPTENPYSTLIQQNAHDIAMIPEGEPLEKIIQNLPEGVYYFLTNANCTEVFNDECKEFLKKILTPISSLENELKNALPFESYSILHFRLGDDELVGNIKESLSANILKMIQDNKEANSVLISDSMSLKMNQEVMREIYVLKTCPGHLGKTTDSNSIKDTLIDFFILSRATHIKSYSSYDWVSGFVNWASKIYDIPLINMRS